MILWTVAAPAQTAAVDDEIRNQVDVIDQRGASDGALAQGSDELQGETPGVEFLFGEVHDVDGMHGESGEVVDLNDRGDFRPAATLSQSATIDEWAGFGSSAGGSQMDDTFGNFHVQDVDLGQDQISDNPDSGPTIIPEPGTFILMLFALSAFILVWDKRRQGRI